MNLVYDIVSIASLIGLAAIGARLWLARPPWQLGAIDVPHLPDAPTTEGVFRPLRDLPSSPAAALAPLPDPAMPETLRGMKRVAPEPPDIEVLGVPDERDQRTRSLLHAVHDKLRDESQDAPAPGGLL